MEVRRQYISFILSKLFSVHDGDMLVVVLNKKNVQKNKRSAFLETKECVRHDFRRVGSQF